MAQFVGIEWLRIPLTFTTALATRQAVAYKQLNEVLIPFFIKQQRYEEAFAIALEVGMISKALALHHDAGGNVLSPDFDAKSVLGPKPNEHWSSSENHAAHTGLLPCFFLLGLLALTSPELIQDQAARVIALCKEIGITASNQDLWKSSAHLLEQCFLAKAGVKALHRESVIFESDLMRCIAYLGETLQSDIRLVDAFSAHAIVVGYTLRVFDRLSTTHRSIILPFIRAYSGFQPTIQYVHQDWNTPPAKPKDRSVDRKTVPFYLHTGLKGPRP